MSRMTRRPRRNVSGDRKAMYYFGMVLIVAGIALFVSTFFTFISGFGDFEDFGGRIRGMVLRAFGGMALIVVGGGMRRVGARGAAGSGLVLDPEQARSDLEPWARMGGGMVNDALDEVDALKQREPDVMVRCRGCKALNDEGAKFCDQCGAEL